MCFLQKTHKMVKDKTQITGDNQASANKRWENTHFRLMEFKGKNMKSQKDVTLIKVHFTLKRKLT